MQPATQHHQLPYLGVRSYASPLAALTVCTRVRSFLEANGLDASVFNITINKHYVVIISPRRLTAADRRAVDTLLNQDRNIQQELDGDVIVALLAKGGERVELPRFAADDLRERRARFKESGIDYWERRTPFNPPPT